MSRILEFTILGCGSSGGVPRADGEPGFEQLGWQVGLSRWSEGWLDARRSEPPPGVTLRIRLDRNPS